MGFTGTAFDGKDGANTDLPARYTFVLVKNGGEWQIVDHHSPEMPK